MIEVKDEVLAGEPKYRIRDASGNILQEDATIEMTTRVVQEPTPLNKVLFDSIETDLNSLYRNIPKGLICMWSGSTIPLGWLLCDGTNGTPDLRNRFVVGSGADYSIGDVGGNDSTTLTIDNMPSHRHEFYAYSGATTGLSQTILQVDDLGYPPVRIASERVARNSTPDLLGNTGGGASFENRPPYYALAYIMKA